MLSYRHGFHAGNHADVLKHMVLCLLMRHFNLKDKPYSVLDTHSASGIYNLSDAFSKKNEEYKTGVSKILNNKKLQEIVPEYYKILHSLNKDSNLNYYMGSPFIETSLSRDCDVINLIDLHNAEIEALHKNFSYDNRVHIHKRDGLQALSALLPLTPRRSLILIDPSYEIKSDYYNLVKALKIALTKQSTATIAIWYPVLSRLSDESKKLVQDIRRLNYPLLQAELIVDTQQEDFGMCGSGMLILNYPFNLEEDLNKLLGELYQSLKNSKDAKAKLKVLVQKA